MKKIKFFTAVFMLCLQGMLACRSDDISPKPFPNASSARNQWENPHSSQDMTAQGIFTFLNGQKAIMNFDEKGEINSLKIDGDENVSYEYDKTKGYLAITKWEIVAYLHQNDNQLKDYEFIRNPIIRWYAYLNSGWSSVQLLNTPEQANIEGVGAFEMIYIPTDKPAIDPIKPIKGLKLDRFNKPTKNTKTNF